MSEPWVVWWWREDTVDVPEERRFRLYPEAVEFAVALTKADVSPEWVKMFGPSERDVRLRWTPGRGFFDLAPVASRLIEDPSLGVAFR